MVPGGAERHSFNGYSHISPQYLFLPNTHMCTAGSIPYTSWVCRAHSGVYCDIYSMPLLLYANTWWNCSRYTAMVTVPIRSHCGTWLVSCVVQVLVAVILVYTSMFTAGSFVLCVVFSYVNYPFTFFRCDCAAWAATAESSNESVYRTKVSVCEFHSMFQCILCNAQCLCLGGCVSKCSHKPERLYVTLGSETSQSQVSLVTIRTASQSLCVSLLAAWSGILLLVVRYATPLVTVYTAQPIWLKHTAVRMISLFISCIVT